MPKGPRSGALLTTELCRGVRLSADPGHRDDPVCSRLRSYPPRHPADELLCTVLSIRSRATLSQHHCRVARRSAGLRAHTLVAKSIENAGTAHSVVLTFSYQSRSTVMPRRQRRGPSRMRT
jgi:hypothetical protein